MRQIITSIRNWATKELEFHLLKVIEQINNILDGLEARIDKNAQLNQIENYKLKQELSKALTLIAVGLGNYPQVEEIKTIATQLSGESTNEHE